MINFCLIISQDIICVVYASKKIRTTIVFSKYVYDKDAFATKKEPNSTLSLSQPLSLAVSIAIKMPQNSASKKLSQLKSSVKTWRNKPCLSLKVPPQAATLG